MGTAVRLSAREVISASGVVFLLLSGSGESGGSREGIGGIGGTTEERLLLAGAVLFRFRGDAFFVGEAGSLGAMLSSGSKICEGSIPSPVFVLLPFVVFLGESSIFAVVCRRVDLRGLAFFGAGVNSSSLSSLMRLNSSSDSSSTTTGLRVARRDGLTGDSIFAISCIASKLCGSRITMKTTTFLYWRCKQSDPMTRRPVYPTLNLSPISWCGGNRPANEQPRRDMLMPIAQS